MMSAALDFERPASLEASAPPEERGAGRDGVRLLVSGEGRHEHARFTDLPGFLPRGTLLVVNRSAVLPASLPAQGFVGPFRLHLSTSFGGGIWLAEPRWDAASPGPLPLAPGEWIEVAGSRVRLVATYPGLPRLWFLRAEGDLGRAMSEAGEPIRYGHVPPPGPPLTAYQTLFASRPGSAEMPSAARPITLRVLVGLLRRGVRLASVVLHSGVSSIEVETDAVADHPLPPEPFSVPGETARAVEAARREGRPVVAVGTTVVRALESAWDGRRVRAAAGFTRRMVHPDRPAAVVDGLLTGFHDPRASHLALLHGIADPAFVRDGYAEAVREGYLWHEFGDSHLIVPRPARSRRFFGAPF